VGGLAILGGAFLSVGRPKKPVKSKSDDRRREYLVIIFFADVGKLGSENLRRVSKRCSGSKRGRGTGRRCRCRDNSIIGADCGVEMYLAKQMSEGRRMRLFEDCAVCGRGGEGRRSSRMLVVMMEGGLSEFF